MGAPKRRYSETSVAVGGARLNNVKAIGRSPFRGERGTNGREEEGGGKQEE